MKRKLPRTILLVATASLIAGNAGAATSGRHTSGISNRAHASDRPLVLFRSIDKRLTLIDSDNQRLRASIHEVQNIRNSARRERMLRQLQRSKAQQERLRAVNQLLTISAQAERRYRNPRQAYGAKLFRDLHGRLLPLKSALLHGQAAPTVSSWTRDEGLVNARLLRVIAEYQAISGGYVALACRPGSWACCQPRTVRDGNATIRGCAWSCTSTLTACHGGCLGRRTPSTVVAVKNTPKPPVFAKPATLASSGKGTVKAKPRLTAPTVAQAAASGR